MIYNITYAHFLYLLGDLYHTVDEYPILMDNVDAAASPVYITRPWGMPWRMRMGKRGGIVIIKDVEIKDM